MVQRKILVVAVLLSLALAGCAAETTSGEAGDGDGTELNESKAEKLIHDRINEERQKRSASAIAWDNELNEIARYHSKRMGQEDFFSHEAPDGERFSDRYDKFGYNCKVPTTGNRYKTGGENIAKLHWEERVRGHGYISDESDVADAVVEIWLDSPPHRQNLIDPHWRREGIGIHVTDDDEIYVTQNFC